MVPELVITALILGWILKGKFGRLADVKIYYGWMIFVPVAMNLLARWANFAGVFEPSSWVFGLVQVVQFVVFLVVAIANRRIPGVNLVYAGLAVNLIAILANGGYMPVSGSAVAAMVGQENLQKALSACGVRHLPMDASTRLKFLCDVIAAHRPFCVFPTIYSVGDIVSSLGVLIAIVAIMINPRYTEKRAVESA